MAAWLCSRHPWGLQGALLTLWVLEKDTTSAIWKEVCGLRDSLLLLAVLLEVSPSRPDTSTSIQAQFPRTYIKAV